MERILGIWQRKLASRIPYKALVADVKKREFINAGRFHGIDEGARLSIFEIKGA